MAQANPHAGGLQPASFQELYALMPDVLNGQHTMYLAPFGPKSGQQPATLRDHVITVANDVPKVFVLLQSDPMPQIICVHHPTRYASSLLGAQLGDDHIFGFQGDVRQGNQIYLVEWPDAPFTCSGMVTVPLLDEMDDAWTNANGADAVRPYATNDPNTEQVCARLLCPIPQCYVGLCVNCTYKPQTFWTDAIGQIRQDQLMVNCNALVNWACVASTYGPPDATGQPTFPLAVNDGLRIPLADEQLAAHRWNWVVEDPPALGHTGTMLE
jgi:hypothetical protein